MNDEEVDRLVEEGIDSVHALAFYSTPKLFFNTPFSLHRICDWQDQALLIALLGASRGRIFRDQLMIRGAIDAQRVALDVTSKNLPATDRTDLLKVLGLSTEVQAQLAFRFLADNEVARRIAIYRKAAPTTSNAAHPSQTNGVLHERGGASVSHGSQRVRGSVPSPRPSPEGGGSLRAPLL